MHEIVEVTKNKQYFYSSFERMILCVIPIKWTPWYLYSLVTGGLHSQKTSNAESISMSWRRHRLKDSQQNMHCIQKWKTLTGSSILKNHIDVIRSQYINWFRNWNGGGHRTLALHSMNGLPNHVSMTPWHMACIITGKLWQYREWLCRHVISGHQTVK